ncbi:helix-turn-helix domain-containing protein [Flavobacterium flavigenum]|uniref:helix-turn-helix domain-containing protein n=1 Tax=Flavobacterium flavigenum TaxID=3003258 RepID=UPI0022ABE908|nr:AraC family transcriptional regulator [Flavobacterium flavigenum]
MTFRKSKYKTAGIQLCVFENLLSKHIAAHLIPQEYSTVLIINTGAAVISINSRKVHLFINELIVIPKRSDCEILLMSRGLCISTLSFTSEFAFDNSIRWPHIGYFNFFTAQYASKIFLKKKDLKNLMYLLALVNYNLKISNSRVFKKELILLSFNLFLYELAGHYYRSSWNEKVKYSSAEKIALQFFRLLEIHCRKQHSVKFYADALNISSGHLTKTIKQITEITAKQCIENALILEAKILLQNNDLTILSISEALLFANTSFFSNFFKRHTSMSPSEYRLKLHSTN